MFGVHETLPAGTYFIGDPGYVLNDALLEKIQHHNGTVTINTNEKFMITQLPYCGNGIIGSDKHIYCIDTLLMSMIPMNFCVKCERSDMEELGSVYTFNHPIDYTVVSETPSSSDKVIEIASKDFYLKLDTKNIQLKDESTSEEDCEEDCEDDCEDDCEEESQPKQARVDEEELIEGENGFFMSGVTFLDEDIPDELIEEDMPDKTYTAKQLLKACDNNITDAIKSLISAFESFQSK